MGLGRGSAIASFPEGSQLDRLTAHLLGTALPPLQSLTRGEIFPLTPHQPQQNILHYQSHRWAVELQCEVSS